MIRLLAISGSLREASSNSTLLRASELLCPEGLTIIRYSELGDLPHFNPDLLEQPGAAIERLSAYVDEADGLLISCPEYARGIPGSFKNMLDWLVSSQTFPGKPVGLFNASPRASHAQAALRLVLETMSAELVEEASLTVNLLASHLDADEISRDPVLSEAISAALLAMREHIAARR